MPAPDADDPAVVHVVDDDEAVRDSLRFLLEAAGFAVRVWSDAAALLADPPGPSGCVLTDFNMPGVDGLQLQAGLAAQGIGLPVIVMTGYGDVPVAVRAMRAGAVDFLEKPFDEAALLDAVRRALAQNAATRSAAAAAVAARRRLARLTPREREVFDLLVAGHATKAIARALGASPRTIEVHRARVFEKLAVDTLPDLVRLSLAAGPVAVP